MMNKSKRKTKTEPVIRRGGYATGFPVTQESIRAISMNGLMLYVIAVGDYRVKDFKAAIEVLRKFSDSWSQKQREKEVRRNAPRQAELIQAIERSDLVRALERIDPSAAEALTGDVLPEGDNANG